MRIYTDGSCLTNGNESGGPGGWAFVCVENGVASDVQSGNAYQTTSARMEIEAVIRALAAIEYGAVGVTVLTDCLTVTHILASYEEDTGIFRRGKHAESRSPDYDLWMALLMAARNPHVRVTHIEPRPGSEDWTHHILVHKAAKAAVTIPSRGAR